MAFWYCSLTYGLHVAGHPDAHERLGEEDSMMEFEDLIFGGVTNAG